MRLSASKLRENIYRILDQVLETGLPIEIERKGGVVRLVAAEPSGKLSGLSRRPRALRGDPEEIVHLDWSRLLRRPEARVARSTRRAASREYSR